MTLQELYDNNPQWRSKHLVLYRSDGEIEYVGASGSVYEGPGIDGEPVVIFAGN